MAYADAEHEAPVVGLVEGVGPVDRGGGIANPDVGHSAGHRDALAGGQKQGGVRERLTVVHAFAEPHRAVAQLLDATDRGALVDGRQEAEGTEPHPHTAETVTNGVRLG